MAPCIFKVDTMWKKVVSFTPRLLYLGNGKLIVIDGWLGGIIGTGLNVSEKKKIILLPQGIEHRISQ